MRLMTNADWEYRTNRIGTRRIKETGVRVWAAEIRYSYYGICVRAGAHCAPLMHKALGTVEQGVVRFSFSHSNTMEEALHAAQAVRELAQEL